MTLPMLLGLLAVSTQTPATSKPVNMGTKASNTNQAGGVIKSYQPIYPSKAQLAGQEGWVDLLINVDETGQMSSATIIKAKPARMFEEPTLNSIKKWQFQQKIVNGQAVPYQLTQKVEFKLKNYTFGEVATLNPQ
ncbi:MAG: energy transducer TonB, partial [Proteobacteria bacterium]|nr:energy transducer TonB [Pseudomonadota bacterium]